MTKRELLESSLADVPDDELVFVVRGSNPAAPETLREYARRVLHFERIRAQTSPESKAAARAQADAAFAMADRMDEFHGQARADELAAGLTADTKNAELEAAAEAEKQARQP